MFERGLHLFESDTETTAFLRIPQCNSIHFSSTKQKMPCLPFTTARQPKKNHQKNTWWRFSYARMPRRNPLQEHRRKSTKNASLKWKSINFSLFYSPDLLPCRSHSIIMETTEENLLENRYCRLLGLCTILCQGFLRHLPPPFNIIQLFMRALDALESGLTSTNWRLKRSSRDVRESRTELFAMQCWESSVSMLWCLLIETEIRKLSSHLELWIKIR